MEGLGNGLCFALCGHCPKVAAAPQMWALARLLRGSVELAAWCPSRTARAVIAGSKKSTVFVFSWT